MRIGRLRFLIVAALVGACGGAGATAPSGSAHGAALSAPASVSSASQASPPAEAAGTALVFRSERYGYAVELPAGWYVRDEAAGPWGPEELSYVGPGTDAFEEAFPGRGSGQPVDPGVTYGLYVSSADVSEGTTLDGWVELLATTVTRASFCQGEPDREPTEIGGAPAIALEYDRSDCSHDHHVVVLGVLHGGRGYALTWLAKTGAADARRAQLDDVLRSFRFTR